MSLEVGIGLGAFVSGSLFASDPTWLPVVYSTCAILGGLASVVLWWGWSKNSKNKQKKITIDIA
jgi:predicted MFS family arabinose efflux permease